MVSLDPLLLFALLTLQVQAAPPAPVAGAAVVADAAVDLVETDIVDGNVVGAKKRALEEAFLRAVERVFAEELADAGLPPSGPLPDDLVKLRATFATAARRYVRSYRVIEEAEAAGKLRLAVAPVVDRTFLRRQIEKTRAVAPAASQATPIQVVGTAGSAPLAPALADALRAAGLQAAALSSGSPSPAAFGVMVKGHVSVDGDVRGAGLVAARCQVDVSVRRPGGTRDVALPTTTEWGFAPTAPDAEKACLERLAPLVARAVVPAVHEAGSAPAAKAIHVSFDVVEPVALERLLRRLRRVGTISRHELRRIALGAADVRMETNLSAESLGKTLVAALADELSLSVEQAGADSLKMSLAVRSGAPPGIGPEEPAEGQ